MLSINKIDNTKIIAASVNNSAKPEAMPENIKEKKSTVAIQHVLTG